LLAHCILFGIVVVLLGMSHSMTASVCLTLTGILMLVSRRLSRPNVARKVHIAVAATLCCAIFPLFVAPSLVQSLGRDTTFSGRTVIWHVLIESVRYPWLGAGYESFLSGPRLVQLKAIIDKTFQEAHNGYLEVWLNLGWIGVSLFAFLVIAGYRNALAAFRRDSHIGSLRLAFFVAVLIEGLTEAPFRMNAPTWFLLLWAMTATSMAVQMNSGRKPQRYALDTKGWHGRSAMKEGDHTNESEIPIAASRSLIEMNEAKPLELSRHLRRRDDERIDE
jgi:exopolysaccharide production protein ExoQ